MGGRDRGGAVAPILHGAGGCRSRDRDRGRWIDAPRAEKGKAGVVHRDFPAPALERSRGRRRTSLGRRAARVLSRPDCQEGGQRDPASDEVDPRPRADGEARPPLWACWSPSDPDQRALPHPGQVPVRPRSRPMPRARLGRRDRGRVDEQQNGVFIATPAERNPAPPPTSAAPAGTARPRRRRAGPRKFHAKFYGRSRPCPAGSATQARIISMRGLGG